MGQGTQGLGTKPALAWPLAPPPHPPTHPGAEWAETWTEMMPGTHGDMPTTDALPNTHENIAPHQCVDDEVKFQGAPDSYNSFAGGATCASAAANGECVKHGGVLREICCASCAGVMNHMPGMYGQLNRQSNKVIQ